MNHTVTNNVIQAHITNIQCTISTALILPSNEQSLTNASQIHKPAAIKVGKISYQDITSPANDFVSIAVQRGVAKRYLQFKWLGIKFLRPKIEGKIWRLAGDRWKNCG